MANALRLVDAVVNPERIGVRESQRRAIVVSIRRAALSLFLEHGFQNVTVEQIASKAEIAPRTFFNHFSAKEECVVFPHQDFSEPVRELVAARPPREAPLLTVAVAFTELFDALDHYEIIRHTIRLGGKLQRKEPALRAADSSFRRIWEDDVTTALMRRGTPELQARIFAIAGIGALKASMLDWAGRSDDTPMATAAREGFATLLTGIGAVEFPSAQSS
jgi:AcrR family transcriptional regulator